MPIEIEGRQNGLGVIYNCRGALTIDDFFQAGLGFLAHPEEIKKWKYGIIDLTPAGAMNIRPEDISVIVEQNKRIAAIAPPGAILAVASPKDLGFGLAHVWEVLVEEIGWEIMTFRSRSEADVWIQERMKQKFDIETPNPSLSPNTFG